MADNRRYRNKMIKDITYTVKKANPRANQIELIGSDGTLIKVTYEDLTNKYVRV